MKTGPDALLTVDNVSGCTKQEKGTDALATAENEYRDAKEENGTRRKRVREHKT
jgi:hypothetical protein